MIHRRLRVREWAARMKVYDSLQLDKRYTGYQSVLRKIRDIPTETSILLALLALEDSINKDFSERRVKTVDRVSELMSSKKMASPALDSIRQFLLSENSDPIILQYNVNTIDKKVMSEKKQNYSVTFSRVKNKMEKIREYQGEYLVLTVSELNTLCGLIKG
jgi:hypothetical protein